MGTQDQRPNFYEGQYLAAGDLAAIVEYLRAADTRHALGAHTWGIAIGQYLVERSAPGAANRKEVTLLPGVAWDGFGRAVVVTRPTRLPESHFANIPYDENLDGGATPKGRAVRVWLNYREVAARQPAPGFESCADDDQNARVAETFEFIVGAVPAGPDRQGNVLIGTETLPAEEALSRFDSAAKPLYDASVPHQTFPSAKRPPRWLIPVGYVRWVARDGDLGYFASSDGVPEFRLKDCTRAFRRYIGAVVENLVAADGAIVLQRRDKNPRERHRLAYLLNCGHKSEELLEDLAWIEGNLRVVGDAKLAGGKLLMRDADGFDEGVPIYLDRTGDSPSIETKKCCEDLSAAPGAADTAAAALAKIPREFRAAIGKKSQNAHRFIVGPEVSPDAAKGETEPSLAPRFVVLSGTGEKDNKDTEGRAGVNTRDPNAALEVKGDWNGEDGAIRVSGAEPTIRYEGGADVGNAKWIAQLTKSPMGAYRIAYRTTAGAWKGVVNVLQEKVGIRSNAPSAPLTVRADGDKEDLIALENKGGSAKWKINLKPDANTGLNVDEVIPLGDSSRLFIKPGGDVGIGTTNPQGRLTINGKVQPAQGRLTLFSSSADFEYDGGDDGLFIFKDTGGKTAFMGTQFGIGTTAPTRPLALRGARATEELMSFEDAGGNTKWHINQKLAAAPVKGFNIAETHVADGRLFIKEGGDVGIGTYDPRQKLHVAGSFLRVNGSNNELAEIGGEGNSSVVLGTRNSGVTIADMRNLTVGFDTHDPDAWLTVWCRDVIEVSDERAKTNIRSIDGALGRISALRGVSYDWKGRAGASAEAGRLGLIAQEVQKVVPQAVTVNQRGAGLSYSALVPLLIEAVKELKAEVDDLRSQVQKLSGAEPKKKTSPV